MRVIITKRSSTKAERLFAEILKKNHIPFIHRAKIEGKEIDFLIGNIAVEIDGHNQSSERNHWLHSKGFDPIHYQNNALYNDIFSVEESIINKYGLYIRSNNGKWTQYRKSI